MIDIEIRMTGTRPLLCHNGQGIDPENPFTKAKSVISAKKNKKTEEDRREIERLDWYSGLYTAPDILGPVMPTGNLLTCIWNAAKLTRKGRDIGRSLNFKQLNVPVAYDGPRDIDELFTLKQFHSRLPVKVSMARVMKVRPQFPAWALVADAQLDDNMMDFDELRSIVELAGLVEGLGDARIKGYGRFVGEVKKL